MGAEVPVVLFSYISIMNCECKDCECISTCDDCTCCDC